MKSILSDKNYIHGVVGKCSCIPKAFWMEPGSLGWEDVVLGKVSWVSLGSGREPVSRCGGGEKKETNNWA